MHDAIRHVEARHRVLGAHLRETVATGTFCCYRPDPPVSWEVRQIESGG